MWIGHGSQYLGGELDRGAFGVLRLRGFSSRLVQGRADTRQILGKRCRKVILRGLEVVTWVV
jgi:hypothetical protein